MQPYERSLPTNRMVPMVTRAQIDSEADDRAAKKRIAAAKKAGRLQ